MNLSALKTGKLRAAVLALVCAGSLSYATPLTIDTRSVSGTQGYLDFIFTSMPPSQPATLTISGLNLGGGTLGLEQTTGDVSGALIPGPLAILNTAQFPPNEDFVPVTFGTAITFDFAFSGFAVTNPDGTSAPSEFTFSILDGTATVPLLLRKDWQAVDPGGFAFTSILDNTGAITSTSYLAAPEPPAWTLICLAFGAIAIGSVRRRKAAVLAAAAVIVCTPARSQTFGNWQQLSPAVSPPVMPAGTVLSYDPARSQVVLFGGGAPNGVFSQDTWVFDGTNWARKTPPGASPAARTSAAMVFDQKTGQMVLFGGKTSAGTMLNDTWTWDGTAWTEQHPAMQPPARSNHVMAYHPMRGQVLLFGGLTATSILGDSWVWDGRNWALAAESGPSPRLNAMLAYSGTAGHIVLFGGTDAAAQILGDTWIWDGVQWTQRFPNLSPPARSSASMSSGEIVLFGGHFPGTILADTWTWDGTNWAQQSVSTQPSGRFGASYLVFDSTAGRVVLFGGTSLNDTWVFTGPFPGVNGTLKYTISPAVYSRVTGTYIVQVTATNTGATVLNGPFRLVLHDLLPANAVNANGQYLGAPYILVTDSNNQPLQALDPGQSLTASVALPVLRFTPAIYGQ